jgi:hypothetical protein
VAEAAKKGVFFPRLGESFCWFSVDYLNRHSAIYERAIARFVWMRKGYL